MVALLKHTLSVQVQFSGTKIQNPLQSDCCLQETDTVALCQFVWLVWAILGLWFSVSTFLGPDGNLHVMVTVEFRDATGQLPLALLGLCFQRFCSLRHVSKAFLWWGRAKQSLFTWRHALSWEGLSFEDHRWCANLFDLPVPGNGVPSHIPQHQTPPPTTPPCPCCNFKSVTFLEDWFHFSGTTGEVTQYPPVGRIMKGINWPFHHVICESWLFFCSFFWLQYLIWGGHILDFKRC